MQANLVLRKANNYLDVFHGQQGWEPHEWTRYQLVKIKGQVYLKFVKGANMPKFLFDQLLKKFNGGK